MLATLDITTIGRADCRAQGKCICQQRLWLPVRHRRRLMHLPIWFGKRAPQALLPRPLLQRHPGPFQHRGCINTVSIVAPMAPMDAYDGVGQNHAVEDREFQLAHSASSAGNAKEQCCWCPQKTSTPSVAGIEELFHRCSR
ncbi:hypothetical protein MY4038_006915 [Beauveria bassiana]